MTQATCFDPREFTVGLGRDLAAALLPAMDDPGIPVDGYTVGVAAMTENAPHAGEMHPDGDEVLYLISGSVRVTLESDPVEQIDMTPGDGMIVPKGVWHTVDIIEPSQIVYITPGPNNQFRPLEGET